MSEPTECKCQMWDVSNSPPVQVGTGEDNIHLNRCDWCKGLEAEAKQWKELNKKRDELWGALMAWLEKNKNK